MFYLFLLALVSNSLAEQPLTEDDSFSQENSLDTVIPDERVKKLIVYVDEPEVFNAVSDKISSRINEKTIVGYVSQYIKNAKAKTGPSRWDSITQVYDSIGVYDRDTISFAYKNCNYKREALACGVENNHYTVKTYINITEHQITTKMILYNSEGLIVNQSTATSEEIVRWIKQQEITIIQKQGMGGNSTMIHIPKEELPLKWQIPPKIWDHHFYKMSIGLFASVKID